MLNLCNIFIKPGRQFGQKCLHFLRRPLAQTGVMKAGVHGDVSSEPCRWLVAVRCGNVRKFNLRHDKSLISAVKDVKFNEQTVFFRDLVPGFFYYNTVCLGGQMSKTFRLILMLFFISVSRRTFSYNIE